MGTYEEIMNHAKEIVENGDTDKVYNLLKDNYKYRERIRNQKEQYEEQLKELKSKIPDENSVVVSKEVFDELSSIKNVVEEVGGVDGIKSVKETISKLTLENTQMKNKINLNEAAKRLGYNSEALEKLIKHPIEFDGDDPVVVIDNNKVKLGDYVSKEFGMFEPVLKGKTTFHPGQGLGEDNDDSTKDIVDKFISKITKANGG